MRKEAGLDDVGGVAKQRPINMMADKKRHQLYGPSRVLNREAAKRLLEKDHVQENLHVSRGSFDCTSETAASFRHHDCGNAATTSKWSSNAQNDTHLHFGFPDRFEPQAQTIVQSDYTPKPPTTQGPVVPDGVHETHLADFCPKYISDRSLEDSLYTADFNGAKSYREWLANMARDGRKVGRKQKTTAFQKSTHFELGSDPASLVSETQRSFQSVGNGGTNLPRVAEGDRSASCVFRPGDYNSLFDSPKEQFVSIQQKDFTSVKPAVDQQADDVMDAAYQTTAHFYLGDHDDPSVSIYKNDFNSSTRTRKLPYVSPPPSSTVMHEPVFPPGNTTSRMDYVKHDVTDRESHRLTNLKSNKEKQDTLAVTLSCKKGNPHHYNSSEASDSFTPFGSLATERVAHVEKEFYHLQSNRALPNQPKGPCRSEVQEHYKNPLNSERERLVKVRAALEERNAKTRDNKQAHFVLGFDSATAASEQAIQFEEKKPTDPNLPAAGKPNGPTHNYSIIVPDSLGARPFSEHALQRLLQQRNLLKNINPRDPLNINLRKAFLEYDKDLSGSISKEELKAVCRDMGVDVEPKELEKLIDRCDTTGKGEIDYHDFALHLSRHQPATPPTTDSTDSDAAQPFLLSTTGRDFKHPAEQRFSTMQKVVIEQDPKRYVPLQPTSFYHQDSSQGVGVGVSTTRKDFIPPEEVCS